MNPIGVQILLSGRERADWLQQCIESVTCCPGLRVTFGPHIDGDTTRARLETFARMEEQWLVWVDPDDVLFWAGLRHMRHLSEHPDVRLVVGQEFTIRSDGSTCGRGPDARAAAGGGVRMSPRIAHHALIHRSALPLAAELIGDAKVGVEWALSYAASLLGDTHTTSVGWYGWRKHHEQAHRRQPMDVPALRRQFAARAAEQLGVTA